MRGFEDEKRIADPKKGWIGKGTRGEDEDVEAIDSYRSRGSSRHLLQFSDENPSLGFIPGAQLHA